MKKNNSGRIFLYSNLVLLLILISGCGKEEQPTLADHVLVVGTNAEYEPFEYIDENGELTGFDVELVEAMGSEMGCEIQWIDMSFDSLIGSMEVGNVEMIAAAVGPSEERKRSCDFSDVYYSGYQSILVNKTSTIKTLEDLKNSEIAVLEGSLSDLIASGENQSYGVIEGAKVKRFKNATQVVQELENNAVDAVLIDSIIAKRFVSDRDSLSQYQVDSSSEDTVFCLKKGDSETVKRINEAMKELVDNGTYDEIYDKYFID